MDYLNDDFLKQYYDSLNELNQNSKPLISMLSILAEENMNYAEGIVKLIERRILEVSSNFKLYCLYLIDSICQNIGKIYIDLFSKNIINIFCHIYSNSDLTIKKNLFKIKEIWYKRNIFSINILDKLNLELFKIDNQYSIKKESIDKLNINYSSNLSSKSSQPIYFRKRPSINHGSSDIYPNSKRSPILENQSILDNNQINFNTISNGLNNNALANLNSQQIKFVHDNKPIYSSIQQQSLFTQHHQQQHSTLSNLLPVNILNQIINKNIDNDNQPQQNYNNNHMFNQVNNQISQPSFMNNNLSPYYLSSTIISQPLNYSKPIIPQTQILINSDLVSGSSLFSINNQPNFQNKPKVLKEQQINNLKSSINYKKGNQKLKKNKNNKILKKADKTTSKELSLELPLELESSSLKIKRQSLIDSLYSGIQCTNCSLRFDNTTDKGRSIYSAHLDWHFRQNHKLKNGNCFKVLNRDWYLPSELWFKYKEINMFEDNDCKQLNKFEFNNQLINNDQNEIQLIKANSDDRLNICSICYEKFDQKWCDDEEEWKLKNAVLNEDKYYHPTCLNDILNKKLNKDDIIKDKETILDKNIFNNYLINKKGKKLI